MFSRQVTSIFDTIPELDKNPLIRLTGLAISNFIGPQLLQDLHRTLDSSIVKEFERREVSTLFRSFTIDKKQRFNKTVPISGSFCARPNKHFLQHSVKSFYQTIGHRVVRRRMDLMLRHQSGYFLHHSIYKLWSIIAQNFSRDTYARVDGQ